MTILLLAVLGAQTIERPVRAVTDPGVVTTRQGITPAGVPSVFTGRVYGVAWGPQPDQVWVLNATQLYLLDWRRNQVLAQIAHKGTPGNQSIASAGGRVFVGTSVRAARSRKALAQVVTVEEKNLRPLAEGLGAYSPGALAVSAGPAERVAVAPLVYENKLAVIDAATGQVRRSIDTGIAPFAAVVNAAGSVAYVSNLGGRPPKAGEEFASPVKKRAEKIPVDARGVASTGTVMRIDVAAGRVTDTIAVGLHPTALAWDEKSGRLYVANGNSESVSVIDTASNQVVRTIEIQPFAQTVRGVAPTALALAQEGATLLVACGGINAVAVVETATAKIRGMIPTAWYPDGLAVSPDGARFAVGSLLGAGSAWRDEPAKRFVHSYRGSVAVVELPDAAQLASYTTAVAENNRMRLAGDAGPVKTEVAREVKATAVPARSGDPSLIEHVVYIIKENRTYDQVLGDMGKGNGDPSLVMFGEKVTPNQHGMADRYVLLDNFYATGGNSGDGHQWATQANETEYCLWPGYQGRSYPYDGSDPMAYSSGGFIWDYALARGKSVRVYGEYAGNIKGIPKGAPMSLLERWKKGDDFTKQFQVTADIAALNRILSPNYPPFDTDIPDVVRSQIFLTEFREMERAGKMPNFTIMLLPSDHTSGASPGKPTPKAMAADNDLALGQIVEALSKSRFWPKMAIFVVEDDAQNGVDHVDGHRTTAFVISPYARRNHVDSTFYSHQSMLKTIELILGLPTMSLFDLIAHDMRSSFTDTPDLTPWSVLTPEQDLMEANPPAKVLRGAARAAALASAKMNWSVPDAIPTERLNRIVWGAVKGWQTPYPAVRRAVFAPLALEREEDDDDRR
ncbi:MAG: bifunctional YncE family protein/alkaline phosphatase family protein [Acidobacteria bacterium]|nr:bifunctional YncE family protein/alkaline phosphatase family protein [Acidobacteriota bacterium]